MKIAHTYHNLKRLEVKSTSKIKSSYMIKLEFLSQKKFERLGISYEIISAKPFIAHIWSLAEMVA